MTAIAIFTGRDGKKLSNIFGYDFLNTRLLYQYNTVRILDYSDEDLAKSKNPFALVVMVAKQALLNGKEVDKKLLEGKLFIFRKLYEGDLFGKRKMQAILTFLDNYVISLYFEAVRVRAAFCFYDLNSGLRTSA